MSEAMERLRTAVAERYLVERELGSGGMATVYLAHDVKHDRHVALKVLRPELAAVLGADRFIQEIKTTAQLQHPHILPLFDSGAADGFLYYVMPYIEGETLRSRLDRETQLGIDEAVRIASDVADALDYAHRHGVIHRDIKPENILLHDGRPMVADFGIAIAVSAAAGGRMTETGLSLGTPHYMSPEQATAEREISARSDVYSLGVVLYEMLAGEPPHLGNSAQAIIMKIVTEDAQPVTRIRKSVPPNVAAAVARAVERLPADRFQSARELADALANPGFTLPRADSPAGGIERVRLHGRRIAFGTAAVALATLALAGWLRSPPPHPTIRYALDLPEDQISITRAFTLSRDGAWLAYVGPPPLQQIWIKARHQLRAQPLAGTESATSFAFSPDGLWIAFVRGGEVRKIPRTGGASLLLSDSATNLNSSVAWRTQERIGFLRSNGMGLWEVPAGGGERTPLWQPPPADGTATLSRLSALPDGRGYLVARCPDSGCTDGRDLWAVEGGSGQSHLVQIGAVSGDYIATGHILFTRPDGALLAVPFDLRRWRTTGPAVPIADSITIVNFSTPLIAIAENGTAAFRQGGLSGGDEHTMVWVDQSGNAAVIDPGWTFRHAAAGSNAGWSLSPDGRRLAIGLNTDLGDDIWVKGLPRDPLVRLTLDPDPDVRPRWSLDGRRVYYSKFVSGKLASIGADGAEGEEILLDVFRSIWEIVPTRTGAFVVRTGGTQAAVGDRSIWTTQPREDTILTPLIASDPWDEAAIALSPDERWIVFESNESGRREIYLRPFPHARTGRLQLSTRGGQSPVWARDGRTLYFVDGDRAMVAVPIETAAPLPVVGERQRLFTLDPSLFFRDGENYPLFDVAADGRFLMAQRVSRDTGGIPPMIITEGWLTELRERLTR